MAILAVLALRAVSGLSLGILVAFCFLSDRWPPFLLQRSSTIGKELEVLLPEVAIWNLYLHIDELGDPGELLFDRRFGTSQPLELLLFHLIIQSFAFAYRLFSLFHPLILVQ